MFSSDLYGYNKKEVDAFISNLKAEHEKTIMNEKLKVLESEQKILEMKNKIQEIKVREKYILEFLESYKKAQAEGNRNIDALRNEQLRMVYEHLKAFLVNLIEVTPQLKENIDYLKLSNEIESILISTKNKDESIVSKEKDAMKVLLSKMKGRSNGENPKEVKIERVDSINKEHPSLIKPVTQMELNENDKYDTLVEKFLNSKPPEEQPKALKIQSNGFDLKEAINPKEDLSEIMKAFDFYSSDDDQE